MVFPLFPSKPATSFCPSEPTLNNYTPIHDLEGGGKGCMWGGGAQIINNNNKALCFVRMRWDETSATKCSEDGNPLLMTSLALHGQQQPSFQAGTRAVITGGKTATQILSDETSGSDDVAPSVHFRGILHYRHHRHHHQSDDYDDAGG